MVITSPEILRATLAILLTDKLQDGGYDVALSPNPKDLVPNPYTFRELYPNRMTFICYSYEKKCSFELADVISINQTGDDLAWTILVTLPCMKNEIDSTLKYK